MRTQCARAIAASVLFTAGFLALGTIVAHNDGGSWLNSLAWGASILVAVAVVFVVTGAVSVWVSRGEE